MRLSIRASPAVQLLNSHGEVIGITTLIASNPNGGADQSAGIGFAIPISTAKAVLSDFATYGRVRRPSLGIVMLQVGPGIAEQIGLPADYGVLVERALPGGAAQRAGLHGGTQRAYMGNQEVMLGRRPHRRAGRPGGHHGAGSFDGP